MKDHPDFKVGQSVGTYKESVTVEAGQLGIAQAIFKGKTITEVGPSQSQQGLKLDFSDGSQVLIKSISPKSIEISYQQDPANHPRRFVVQTG